MVGNRLSALQLISLPKHLCDFLHGEFTKLRDFISFSIEGLTMHALGLLNGLFGIPSILSNQMPFLLVDLRNRQMRNQPFHAG